MPRAVCQKWEESERGWGTRPDGYSLHKTREDVAAYIKAYWDTMPDSAPSEYSRPDGTPYDTEVDQETYDEIAASKNGIRSWGKKTPEGGTDGWLPLPGGGSGRVA